MKQNQHDPSANERELTVKINREFIFRNISLILSIALLLSLFTTFCVINSSAYGYGNDLALSGFDVLLGFDFSDGSSISGGFFGLIMVLAPPALILSNYLKALAPIKKLMLFLAPLAGFIASFIAERTIASQLNFLATRSMGYYLYLILSLAMIGVGFLQYKNIPLNRESVQDYVSQATKRK